MKGVIAIACLLSAVYVGADIIDIYLENTKDLFISCAKENGYTVDDPNNLRPIFDKDGGQGVDGSTCLRGCVMKALGMMNGMNIELGGINTFINSVHTGNPETIALLEKAAADCAEKTSSLTDQCKVAFVFTDCFLAKH